jgi:hypothetical protein
MTLSIKDTNKNDNPNKRHSAFNAISINNYKDS